jgi:hypothetical protein
LNWHGCIELVFPNWEIIITRLNYQRNKNYIRICI